jgi:hypothetical protein
MTWIGINENHIIAGIHSHVRSDHLTERIPGLIEGET